MILKEQHLLSDPVKLGELVHVAQGSNSKLQEFILHLIILLTAVRENFEALEDVEAQDSLF